MRLMLLMLAVTAGAATSASAAVTVIGGGQARACYLAAVVDVAPTRGGFASCDGALTQEMLGRRDRAATFTNRAVLHLRTRDGGRALADLDAAQALAPEIADIEVNRAAALLLLARPQEAEAAATRGFEAGPQQPWSALYNRAVAREMLGDAAGAYTDYNLALALKPGWRDALDQLARFRVIRTEDGAGPAAPPVAP